MLIHRLTDQQLLDIGWKIIDFFYGLKGDPYGWDWPTMWVLYPAKCSLFRRLRNEWKRRHP